MCLKRLKYLFGQRSKIAQATLLTVTQGAAVPNDDNDGLLHFYYTVSDCLVGLRMLNYEADLYSSDTLRRAVQRLPSKLITKWAERSMSIRERGEEPNLLHFEAWLQRCAMVTKEVPVVESKSGKSKTPEK